MICWTSLIVRRNCPTPRCASVSHCSGTITSSAAVSPLRVSTPSDGGQSMITTSKSPADLRQRTLERVFAARPHQQHRLGAGQVDVGGHQRHPLRRRHQRRGRLHVAEQHLVDRHRQLVGILAERERQTALRIQVDEQHPSTLLRHRRTQRRHRRRLGYPTLLIGDRKYSRHAVHPSTHIGHDARTAWGRIGGVRRRCSIGCSCCDMARPSGPGAASTPAAPTSTSPRPAGLRRNRQARRSPS